jgi:GT2 family glycosyltransferase
MLIKMGEPIKVLRNEKNLGYLLGANQAWKTVKTPYVLQLNNDVTLDKQCITLMHNVFDMDPKIGIVGAVQYFPDGKREPPLRYFQRKGEAFQDVGNTYREEIKDETLPYIECDVVGFACAMIKREVWEDIGYYDEVFSPCHYEQEDFCCKAKLAGWKVALCPQAHFVHIVAASTSANLPYFTGIVNRNRKIFLEKWEKKLREGKV